MFHHYYYNRCQCCSQNKYQIVCESSEIEALNVDMNTFDDNRWKLLQALDNNRQRGFDQNSKISII